MPPFVSLISSTKGLFVFYACDTLLEFWPDCCGFRGVSQSIQANADCLLSYNYHLEWPSVSFGVTALLNTQRHYHIWELLYLQLHILTS